MHNSQILYQNACELLKGLIRLPSYSTEENKTTDLIQFFLEKEEIKTFRYLNNVWAKNLYFDEKKPTILLNSHHDTVKPNAGYTLDPFEPLEKEGKLYGLGSNDAGASLVSLWAVFVYFFEKKLPFNLIFAATAEEEISGKNGIEALLEHLPKIALGIVGEPTQMHMAVAERGLMVLDCTVKGKAGHAARNEGENAIYKAMKDIEWFKNYRFPRKSDYLGEIGMNITLIQAGQQHNVVPDICRFTVDVRSTDAYTNLEILEIIKKNTICEVQARSTRLNPSGIRLDHPIVQKARAIGRNLFASPTLSDQALMPFETVKMGVGLSARSHTADEFVFLEEIEEGIGLYIKLLEDLIL